MDDLVSKYGKKEEKSLDTNGVVNIFDKYFPGLLLTDCLNESMMMYEIKYRDRQERRDDYQYLPGGLRKPGKDRERMIRRNQ